MMPETSAAPEEAPTRAGYVALVGRPNAGKSTLLNRLVGQKLSIVTPRAQTTWQRVTGIRTTETSQAVFLDTPGLLDVKDLLQRSFLGAAHEALRDADVVVLVVDASRRPEDTREDARIAEALEASAAPLLVAVNKIDEAPTERVAALEEWARETLDAPTFPISATRGDGVEALLDAMEARLPPGPFLYPEDDVASQPVRFFVAELVRETVFEHFRQEVPYAVFARVEEFREDQEPLYVQVTLYVERESQKGILVGKRGSAIKALGRDARRKIEHFLGRAVYLELWVKTLAGWRRKRTHLSRLGFHVPEDDARALG